MVEDAHPDFPTVVHLELPLSASTQRKVKSTVLECKLQDRRTAKIKIHTKVDIHAWQLFDTLSDPANLKRTNEDIEDVKSTLLEETGPVRKWHVDCQARWRFWKLSGSCVTKMFMVSDSDKGTIKFSLREPGFLRTYEGSWTISALPGNWGAGSPSTPTPLLRHRPAGVARTSASSFTGSCGSSGDDAELAAGSRPGPFPMTSITLEVTMSPKLTPPFPLNQLLKGQTKGQANKMMNDIVKATRSMQWQ